jgi:hypothetical protein
MRTCQFTEGTRDLFIRTLADSGNVSHAAQKVGINRRTAYHWRKSDAEFRLEWDHAIETAVDALEAEARRRAMDGVEETQYYRGEPSGVLRKYSDALLILLLKAHRPDKFRDRAPIAPAGAGPSEADAEGAKERLESHLEKLRDGGEGEAADAEEK